MIFLGLPGTLRCDKMYANKISSLSFRLWKIQTPGSVIYIVLPVIPWTPEILVRNDFCLQTNQVQDGSTKVTSKPQQPERFENSPDLTWNNELPFFHNKILNSTVSNTAIILFLFQSLYITKQLKIGSVMKPWWLLT